MEFRDLNPIDTVYADVITHKCPRCLAAEGAFCTNPVTHKISKIPCGKRLKFAPVVIDSSEDEIVEINGEEFYVEFVEETEQQSFEARWGPDEEPDW